MGFWERFADECEKKGEAPSGVCAELGLGNSAATAWKRGTCPRSDVVARLAGYLGVSADYLLGVSDDPVVQQSDPQLFALSKSLSDLTPQEQQKVMEFLDFVKSQRGKSKK